MLKTLSEKDIQRYAHQIILKNIGIDITIDPKAITISTIFNVLSLLKSHNSEKENENRDNIIIILFILKNPNWIKIL